MRKIILVWCILIPLQCLAISVEESTKELIYADLRSKGLVLPDSGVTIIKSNKVNSFIANEEDNPLNDPMRQDYVKKLAEMKATGYAKRYSEEASYLLSMKNQKASTDFDSDPQDTHFKTNLSKIKFAFPYVAIPFIKPESLIGYAPKGAWKNGWTGFAVYFNDDKLGTCKVAVTNFKVSHGGVQLIDQDITYDVNEKPTSLLIEGSPSSGFFYHIGWYDDTYMRSISCATQSFDATIKNQLISFAKKLDASSI
jgi:hypothetical protein